jgi:non-specific protein-tyrosine kinase
MTMTPTTTTPTTTTTTTATTATTGTTTGTTATTATNGAASTGPIRDAEVYEKVDARSGPILLTKPRSVAAEQFRVLRHRVELLGRAGVRGLAVTSAEGREGRTTTAVNLALALAHAGRAKVALVDGDLRGPGVHRMLGLTPTHGLCDVVAGRAVLKECLWAMGGGAALEVLPAGVVPEDVSSVLDSRRLAEVLGELRARFDFVIVDAPPVLRLADVPSLCASLDGALVVARAGVTARELVLAAIDALVGVTVHGIVLNDVDPSALAVHAPIAARLLPATSTVGAAAAPSASEADATPANGATVGRALPAASAI